MPIGCVCVGRVGFTGGRALYAMLASISSPAAPTSLAGLQYPLALRALNRAYRLEPLGRSRRKRLVLPRSRYAPVAYRHYFRPFCRHSLAAATSSRLWALARSRRFGSTAPASPALGRFGSPMLAAGALPSSRPPPARCQSHGSLPAAPEVRRGAGSTRPRSPLRYPLRPKGHGCHRKKRTIREPAPQVPKTLLGLLSLCYLFVSKVKKC